MNAAHRNGLVNLAEFVAASTGPRARVIRLDDGAAVAGPVPVVNGYINAAMRTDQVGSAEHFVQQSVEFFATMEQGFVLWAPESDPDLVAAASRHGGVAEGHLTPAMSTSTPVACETSLQIAVVESPEMGAVFGDLAERGYDKPGLAWLLDHQGSYLAEGVLWVIAFDGPQAVGVGAGFLHGSTGGVYYIATPSEFRGRGVAAAVTAWLTNLLLSSGAQTVTLQSSAAGFSIYERLGFSTYDRFYQFEFSSPV